MPIVTIYHRNGEIRETRPIENGMINGVVKRYSEDGKLVREIPYVDGVKHGVKKQYYPDGTIKAEIPYEGGSIHGLKKRFNKHGILFESIRFNQGNYVDRVFYDSDLASGLTEEEKAEKVQQDNLFKEATSIFIKGFENGSILDESDRGEACNPKKVIYDDEESVGEVLERPKEKRIVDPQVESFTHPEENGRFLKERIDRGVIVGNSDFTSETVTSFEITYFKGTNQESAASPSKRPAKENPITVWIEKGDGVEFKTRVWIRNGKWFGRFITSKNVSWEHYMWVLFQKFNVLEWNSDRGIDTNPEEYGSIRIYSKEHEKNLSWTHQKPQNWDEFLTFFNRFFGKNTRTSFEEGFFLTKEQVSFLDNGGAIKDFCDAKYNLQNLQKPDDIFYPKDTMPCKCPCCGGETDYKNYQNHAKRFCHKCYANVCTKFPLPANLELSDFVSSIRIEFATDLYFTKSTVGSVLTISKDDQLQAQYTHLENGEWEKFSNNHISENTWRDSLEILFNKAFCHEWAQAYQTYDEDNDDEKSYNWGVLRIDLNYPRLGFKKIQSFWSGKEPPYWNVAIECVQSFIEKLKEVSPILNEPVGKIPDISIISRECGPDEFIDERDGNIYKTVKIGGQIWMAENLRYAPPQRDDDVLPRSLLISEEIRKRNIVLDICKSELIESEQSNSKYHHSFRSYKELEEDIKFYKSYISKTEKNLNPLGDGIKLGRLYTWISANDLSWKCLDDQDQVPPEIYEAMNSTHWQGIAPKGWRIPSREDFEQLYVYCTSHSQNKTAVSMKSKSGWVAAHKKLGSGGTDEFGFCALPSGFCSTHQGKVGDIDLGLCAMYWTCSPEATPEESYLTANACYWEIEHRLPNLYPMRDIYEEEHFHEEAVCKDTYMAIRCIKNE